MLTLLNDLRFAFRQLFKNPGFVFAVTLTLALGVGVNTAVFSLVNAFLLRPLPYPDPDRLGVLILHSQGISPKSGQFAEDDDDSQDGKTWEMIRNGVPAARAAAFGGTSGINLQAGSGSNASIRYVQDMRVSADYFSVLGVQPFLGRGFSSEEDTPNGPKAAVLSYALWQSAFHADPQVLGQTAVLKGEPHSIVGVLPPGAQVTGTADLWTPLQPHEYGECGGNNCEIILRLVRSATWQQVAAQLARVHSGTDSFTPLQPPSSDGAGEGTQEDTQDGTHNRRSGRWFYVSPLAKNLDNGMRKPVLGLMAAVGLVLLIACANLAGLTLIRIMRRTPEIATRLALGATRLGILRQLWLENLVLSFAGAALGLALARAILSWLPGFMPAAMLPLGGITIDVRVLTFTVGAAVLTSLLFGGLPALQTRRVDLRSSIALGGRSVAGGSNRLRQVLIGCEVALTLVLVAGAGLVIRSLIYLETLPPGFDASNVMTAKVSLDDARYHDASAFHNLIDHSVAAMHTIPGVEHVAVALSVPYERGLNDGVKAMDGKLAGKDWGSSLSYVSPEFFQAFRIPILTGRDFSDGDTSTSQPVAVVNADFARDFFNEPNPVGRHIKSSSRTYTIVGVVANVAKRPGMNGDAPVSTEPVFYLPAAQTDQELVNIAHVWFQPSWVVRTAHPVQGLTAAMQQALAQVDPNLPFSGFYSMEDLLATNLSYQRVEVALLSLLGGLAILLSAVGIYGLVSNLIVQRTREIGIRMALGSTIQRAMLDVGSAGLVAAGIGVVAGLALSFVMLRFLRTEIYGVGDYDPLTLTLVPLLLVVIAAGASFLPSLRITRIDPSNTLRAE